MGSATWPRPPVPWPRTMDSEATLCYETADLEGTTANESLQRKQQCLTQENEKGQSLGQDKSPKTDDFGSWHCRYSQKVKKNTNTHGHAPSKEPPYIEKAIGTKVTSESWLSEEHGKDPLDTVELKRDNSEWGDGGEGEDTSAVDLGVREVLRPLPTPSGKNTGSKEAQS